MTTLPCLAELLDLSHFDTPPFQTVTVDDLFATYPDFSLVLHSIAALGNRANAVDAPASPSVLEDLNDHIEHTMGMLKTGFNALARLHVNPGTLSASEREEAMNIVSWLISADSVRFSSLYVLRDLTAQHNALHATTSATPPTESGLA